MMKLNIEEIAKMIDHSLLHPTMTDEDLRAGCEIAKQYKTASVCIKPYAVKQAVEWLRDSGVPVCTVIGFPHGSHTTEIKVAECRLACEEGAAEIDMVVNIGKVLGGDWEYVTKEIQKINGEAIKHGAILKVIFENDFLQDEHKIRLCEICSNIPVAFVKTSTGYGYVKGADGKFSTKGATLGDVMLMRKHSAAGVEVKAAGGVRTLDELLMMKEAGATRIGATATAVIIEEAKKRSGLISSEIKTIDKGSY